MLGKVLGSMSFEPCHTSGDVIPERTPLSGLRQAIAFYFCPLDQGANLKVMRVLKSLPNDRCVYNYSEVMSLSTSFALGVFLAIGNAVAGMHEGSVPVGLSKFLETRRQDSVLQLRKGRSECGTS